jgi:hypothetical protein
MELINQKKAGFGACKHRQRILVKPHHFCTVFRIWIPVKQKVKPHPRNGVPYAVNFAE